MVNQSLKQNVPNVRIETKEDSTADVTFIASLPADYY